MNLSHDSPELENAFWIIADPNKPFLSSPLRFFQCYQFRLFLSFLCLWSSHFAIFSAVSWILNMNCETGKVYNIFLSQEVNHYWPWNDTGEEVKFEIWEILQKDRKATRSNAQKRTKKNEADKIGKDATGLRQRLCSDWLWSKKSFQVRGNQGIDL